MVHCSFTACPLPKQYRVKKIKSVISIIMNEEIVLHLKKMV